jgi:hypothetical protein
MRASVLDDRLVGMTMLGMDYLTRNTSSLGNLLGGSQMLRGSFLGMLRVFPWITQGQHLAEFECIEWGCHS